MKTCISLSVLALTLAFQTKAVYVPLRESSGNTFFDKWDYADHEDNTTWGNVTYVTRDVAMSSKLTFVDGNGHAIVRVDNTTTITLPAPGQFVHRNSVRITTQDTYGFGNLIMIDVHHLPWGCSVWPSFWTLGTRNEWPGGGEIDIIEGINKMTTNQMALHTVPGCAQFDPPGQMGKTLEGDCSADRGCIVQETKPDSFGDAFFAAGGGIWAAQIDVSGVYIWFWSRPNVPSFIPNATSDTTMDPSLWGTPSAAYPAQGCDITKFSTPQQLVLLTTLWPEYQNFTAAPDLGHLEDNVIGPGSPTYDDAYWDIAYIRTYIAQNSQPGAPSLASTTVNVKANTQVTTRATASTTSTSSTTGGVTPSQSSSAAMQFSYQSSWFIGVIGMLGILRDLF
ncbi:glycoside hydrolase family 16 protein [Amanita thiersii Skay4041]|uniref:Glycoside hydrolase family 16 protein n=1 Tax=Amanita thiersii Skay4041 TaxID=703135 RepID=A0A2A9NCQ6_9AGAR|nr:glycoside hydrolase family 16 protein [Amanita thiersii Skay4041]